MGRTVDEIHRPVHRYDFELARRVNSYFTNLKPGSAGMRSNWFFHPDAELFAPRRRSVPAEPSAATDVATRLWLRSERQLLAKLAATGTLLFAIRTRQIRLDELADRADLRAGLAQHLRACPPRLVEHRGVGWCIEPLLEWLDR